MSGNIPKLIRQYVQEELRGVYTVSVGIVEDVDHENRHVEVSLKADPKVVMSHVPIATTHAHPPHGELYPLEPGIEGLILHPKEPVEELIIDPGHNELDLPPTEFRLRDGFFFPQFFNDNDTTPSQEYEYHEGDYLYAHPSGTATWIHGSEHPDYAEGTYRLINDAFEIVADPEEEEVTVEAENVTVEADSISLGDGDLAAALNENATIEYDDTDADGDTETKEAEIVDPGSEDVELS